MRGGVGHVAGACPTSPATAARLCLFCQSLAHSTAACRSKPTGWAPGINRHRPVQGAPDAEAIAVELALHLGLTPPTAPAPTPTLTPPPPTTAPAFDFSLWITQS